jgi:hypothetical protein
MTAVEFVAALKKVTPLAKDLVSRGETLEYAQRVASYGEVTARSKPLVMGYNISYLFTELFSKFDLTKLRITNVSFFDRPLFEDHRWFFGYESGERIFIDPETQEVRAEEARKTEDLPGLYLEWGFAKDFDHFMAALLVVAEYYGLYNMDTPGSIRLDYAIRAAKAAGGKQYKGFLAYDIDNDAYERALDVS